MKSGKTSPFFTIIIPCLNEEKHLPQLLKDITRQTFTDFNVIVVDAHSEDNTVAKAKTFAKDINLSVVNSTKRHVSYQRNLGAKNTTSPWLIFMDADNQIPPYFLQGIKYRVEENNPSVMTVFVEPDSNNPQDTLLCHVANLYIDMQKKTFNPYVFESCMVFKRDIFEQLHGFSDTVAWGEGNELLRRAYKENIHLTVCKTPTYKYSTRRLKKDGTLKLARNVAAQELYRILKIPIKGEVAEKLYPMKGGLYFDQKTSSKEPLLRLLSNFSNPKQFRHDMAELLNRQINLSSSLEPLLKLFNAQEKPKAARTHSAKANKK
jgi:glycosyltransferase involved in cell wall biosynthesis